MGEAAAVEVSNLTKIYPDLLRRRKTQALSGVSLRVERGVIYGLLGQNGAGKTTLVKILLSLVRPTAGTASIFGHTTDDTRARRRIGFLPEHMRIPEYFKANSFLSYMGRLNGVDSATLKTRIPTLLELVGLPGEKKLVKAYSKGMQQRLGLAQALLNDPDLLFLDEPTEGLDPIGRKQVRDLLLTLRAGGKTIFLNSHILSEVELVCDQLMILNRGEKVRDGKPSDFATTTGEYRLRVAAVTDAVHATVQSVVGPVLWDGTTASIKPRDRAHLNELIDRLRAANVEIEAIEPLRSTLEQFFIEVVAGKES